MWQLFRAGCRVCLHEWQAITPDGGTVFGLACPRCGSDTGSIQSARTSFDVLDDAVAEGERRTRPTISPREWAD